MVKKKVEPVIKCLSPAAFVKASLKEPRASDIEAQLARLGRAADNVAALSNDITTRLEPVLCEQNPSDEANEGFIEAETPLGLSLAKIASVVEEACDRLEDTIRRIAL